MDHDGIEAADLEHHHVAGELLREFGVHHGVAAELHDDDLVIIALQEGQGLGQDAGSLVDGQFGHLQPRSAAGLIRQTAALKSLFHLLTSINASWVGI